MSTTKSSQARSIMGGLESSIETLRIMKAKMSDTSSSYHQFQWAIGSIITMLVSNLLRICNTVIGDSLAAARNDLDADASSDLRRIQAEFNEFIDRMLGNE